MNKSRFCIPIFILTAFSFSFSQKTADFLILDNPRKFTILNSYQEPLTEPEKAAFVPGIPLQIINSDETLGDQITKALSGVFGGKTWYLQKDDAGNFLGAAAPNESRQLFKICDIAGDTVRVIRDKAVQWSDKMPSHGAGRFLAKGETMVLVFRFKGQWYARRDGKTAQFGWCPFSSQSAWRALVHESVADTGISNFLQDRILERFRTANDTYRKYFGHFNAMTGKEKTIPVWQWETAAGTIRCALNAPYRNSSWLDESSRYLVRDIENMLAGRSYDVVMDKTDIIIRPKNEAAK